MEDEPEIEAEAEFRVDDAEGAGTVGGPGGVRRPWSREGEMASDWLELEGTSSSSRACRLTEGLSLQVRR